jgi:hypothetical protein
VSDEKMPRDEEAERQAEEQEKREDEPEVEAHGNKTIQPVPPAKA